MPPSIRAVPSGAAHDDRRADARLLLLVAAATVAFFVAVAPGAVTGRVMRPLDALYQYSPYAQHRPDGWTAPRNNTISDSVLQTAPTDLLVRSALREGRVPAWNPAQAAGTPLLADGISAPFDLPRLLSALVPASVAPALTVLLRMLLASVGMAALLRFGFRTSRAAAAFGAATYVAGGPIFAQVPIVHGAAAVWLPLTVLGGMVAAKRGDPVGAVCLALPAAGLLLAGHPGTAFVVLLGTAAVGLWTSRRPAAVAALAAGAVLAGALAAPYLLPHVVFTGSSHQAAARGASGFPFFDWGRLRVWAVRPFTLISPALLTAGATLSGWRRLRLDTFPESSLAIGLVAFSLAAVALRHRRTDRRVRAAIVCGVVSLCLTLRVPGVSWLVGLPFVRLMNPNQFVQLLLAAIALLVSIGADALREGIDRSRATLARVITVVGAVCAATWIALLAAWEPIIERLTAYADLSVSYSSDPFGTLLAAREETAVRTLVQVAAYAAAIVVVRRGRHLLPLLGGVLAIEAVAFWFTYIPTVPSRDAPPPAPELAEARRLAGDGRVAGLGRDDLEPNTAGLYGLRDINVYNNVSARTGRYTRLIGTSEPASHHVDARAAEHPGALDVLALRVLVVGPGVEPLPGMRLVRDGPIQLYVNPREPARVSLVGRAEVEVDEERTLDLVGDAGFDPAEVVVLDREPRPTPTPGEGAAQLVVDEPEHLVVRTRSAGPRVLVVADSSAPGWSARVDGRPTEVLVANGRVRAVALPAGVHTVTFDYVAPGFRTGVRIGALALLLMVGAVADHVRRHRWAGRGR